MAIVTSIFLATLIVIQLAKGYRPDWNNKSLRPTGLLAVTSQPTGAQVWINQKLKGATDTTFFLTPGEYEVEIKKDGYTSWKKTLTIEKELVTKADAYLFPHFPDLKTMTFTGALKPVLSPDGTKVVFGVSGQEADKNGLWVLDLTEIPFVSKEPRMILKNSPAGPDFTKGSYSFSPDSRQVLLTIKTGRFEENYLLDPNVLTSPEHLQNITPTLPLIQKQWEKDQKEKQQQKMKKLPEELISILENSTKNISFSPDETKILYTATDSATLADNLIPPVPAASNQKQERTIKKDHTYVYDIKEDRNFFITDQEPPCWFPTSKHLYWVSKNQVTIIEYDGTNRTAIYEGPFENTYAFPFPSGTKLLVLTSLGKNQPANLYSASLR